MNEAKLSTETIRQLLNRSSARIEQPALARLRDARTQALARYDARSAAPAFVWAGFSSKHTTGPHRNHYLYWIAAALLAASLFSAVTYWKSAADHDHDVSDVDIAILTDDLPIDVYVN